jgi:uncharacterized membrane protein
LDSGRVVPTLLGASLALSLGAGATLKGDCFGADKRFWRSRLCYTDIQPLYHGRGIDRHVFPYIHATLTGGVGRHGFNEYPVLTGLVMWATGWPSASVSSYLAVTMIELALCAMLAAWLLWRMVALRAVFWTLSPILVLYAFQNWDLLAIAASVAGVYLWWCGRPRAAAVAFAVGGAFKLYPALFILPLVIDQVMMRRTRGAADVGLIGFGSLAVINLPFVFINASGWWATYRFHADRAPTTSGTIWAVLDPHLSTATENRASFHHSNPIPTNGLDDHFSNLQYRDANANWNLWGGVVCQDAQAGFMVNRISGHEYTSGDGTGYCSTL